MNYELSVMSYEFRIKSYELRVMSGFGTSVCFLIGHRCVAFRSSVVSLFELFLVMSLEL